MIRKNGILLYDRADAERNRWFIQRLCEAAEPEGLSLRLCIREELCISEISADFLINRSRNAGISRFCEEELRIPVYNSAQVTDITNDKYKTHLFLRAHGLPTADTVLVEDAQFPRSAMPPLVAKPPCGHGGEGVRMLSDLYALKQAEREMPRPLLLQEPVQTGWDPRVYVMGGEIYAAVLRTSDSDFRSNYSLGGSAALMQPDSEMQALVSRVQAALPLDFAGVDFLRRKDGSYVIGEIEDAVGCRMLYALTAFDPAADFIRMISGRLLKCSK